MKIGSIKTSSYKIPTHSPESDGTIEWDATTMVLVLISAGGQQVLDFLMATKR